MFDISGWYFYFEVLADTTDFSGVEHVQAFTYPHDYFCSNCIKFSIQKIVKAAFTQRKSISEEDAVIKNAEFFVLCQL